MKNILLYTDTPQIGGAELQIFLLAKFLNKNIYTPILACSRNLQLNAWCEKFKIEGIKVIRIKAEHKHNPKHFFELKKIIKKEKIDLAHLHIWNPASCRYGFLAANSTKTPIITTEHDPFKLTKVKDLIKKYTLKKTKTIITVSKRNQKLLTKLYPEHKNKIHTIHNGIDINWWQSQLLGFRDSDRKKIKEDLFHAKENTLIITTIATLHKRKGIQYLIDSISGVVEKYSNVKFVIIGKGPDKKEFEKQASNLNINRHIIFLGQQKHIPKLLKSSDIFILPSIREAFGLVNLEAMICKIPVIATKTGGIPEIITNKENGILIQSKNSDTISTAIKELISKPEYKNKLTENAYKTATETFSAKKMSKEYEKIYETILTT